MNQLSCAVAKLIDPMPHLVGGDHPAFKLVAAGKKTMLALRQLFPTNEGIAIVWANSGSAMTQRPQQLGNRMIVFVPCAPIFRGS
jgi:hypothetical protein